MSNIEAVFGNEEFAKQFEDASMGNVMLRLQIDETYPVKIEDLSLGHDVRLVVSTGIGVGRSYTVDDPDPGFSVAITAEPISTAWIEGRATIDNLNLPVGEVKHTLLKRNSFAIVNPFLDDQRIVERIKKFLKETHEPSADMLRSAVTIAGTGLIQMAIDVLEGERGYDKRAGVLARMSRLALAKLEDTTT